MHIYANGDMKYLRSTEINYNFNLKTGRMETWGKTYDDDPDWNPHGPTIWDAEISEKCSGINGKSCSFCYKGNVGSVGRNMSLETFKKMFYKIPKTLTQIALGIGDIDANPDLYPIMEFIRSENVIPNITINGDRMKELDYKNLARLCGAVSVSYYNDKDICFNAIEKLQAAGLKSVNIHVLASKETIQWCYDVIEAKKTDPKLKNLNAIVFLALKQKGRGEHFHPMSILDYEQIVIDCLNSNIGFGFDSCGANKFIETAKKLGREDLIVYAEPCESASHSLYSNVEGKFFPCSFAEDVTKGLDLVNCQDFMKDIWMHPSTVKERKKIQVCGRSCPYFNV